MAELRQLVPCANVCQMLKEAGFPQGTAFSWYQVPRLEWGNECKEYVAETEAPDVTRDKIEYAAPTADEILRELPETIGKDEMTLDVFGNGDTWMVGWYRYKRLLGWMKEWHSEQPGLVMGPLLEAAINAYLWWKALVMIQEG